MEMKIAFYEKNKQLNIDVILSIFLISNKFLFWADQNSKICGVFFSRFVGSELGIWFNEQVDITLVGSMKIR